MTVYTKCYRSTNFSLENEAIRGGERARDVLTRVGLEDKLNEYPANLSGGQQQRAAIARALAMRSVIILFDERISSDPELRHEVVRVVQEACERE
ncbi:MAG: hypothetical protein CM15mP73_0100 [Hyphomicrobiales bacterium]|nr:MAG: hypothetical protein CM15mP73_0100 [Hyphomicrobiales bacterium]